MKISLFPLFIPPYVTTPSISLTTAGFEGFLASNSSVTLGKPPVISLDCPIILGILDKMVPGFTLSPLSTDK